MRDTVNDMIEEREVETYAGACAGSFEALGQSHSEAER
jgi:hypothetical protein